jgi:hypothetical protein
MSEIEGVDYIRMIIGFLIILLGFSISYLFWYWNMWFIGIIFLMFFIFFGLIILLGLEGAVFTEV